MSTSAEAAADVFQRHRDELGFVNRAQCEEKDLVTVERDGDVVGAALANHCVRKPQTTLYDIAVVDEYRREGIAGELIRQLERESPHKKIVAKCPSELPANEFYRSTGWRHVDREDGKNRPLNVWEYAVTRPVEVYMTVNGGTETAETIRRSAGRVGVESSNTWPLSTPPQFVDFPFTDPNAGFDEHLASVKRWKPKLTVAPDVEHGRSLSQVVDMADRLAEHAEAVIIVPKECHPTDIPNRHRVGLTVGSFGSMSPWGLWQYRDAGPVHILGGTPTEQLAVGWHGIDVASVDSFTLGMRARFGLWDGGAKDADENMDYYDRLETSLNNYVQAWTEIDAEKNQNSEER